MCVDWSSILFKFHCTWCHVPKTGIVGIPLTLNLGQWIQVSAEHPAEEPTVPCGEEIGQVQSLSADSTKDFSFSNRNSKRTVCWH